jgi:hypothetical protein
MDRASGSAFPAWPPYSPTATQLPTLVQATDVSWPPEAPASAGSVGTSTAPHRPSVSGAIIGTERPALSLDDLIAPVGTVSNEWAV